MPIKTPDDAYCTLVEVQSLLPQRIYDGKSRPTLDAAESIIKDIAKEINGTLRALGYSPPLTGSNDKEDLKTINKYGAASIIESATLIGVQGQSVMADNYRKKFETMMEKLEAGEWKFKDAGAPDSAAPDADADLETGGEREDPIFRNSEDQRKNQF